LGEGENPKNKRLRLPGEVGKEYKHTEVRRIGMSPEMSQSPDFASKMDRAVRLLRENRGVSRRETGRGVVEG
jgi:hypothetical protein